MWLWGSSARSGVFVETPQYSLHTPPQSPSRDGGLTATKSETFIMLTSQTSVANSGVTGGERTDSTQLPHPFVEYAENPVLRDTTSSNREDTMEQVFRQNFMDIVRREHLKQNPEYIVTSEHDVSRKPQDRNNRAIVVELDDEEEEERSPFKQSGQQQSSLYNLATDGTEAQSLTTKKEDSVSPFVETVCALPTRAAAQACQSPLEAQMRTKGDGSTSPVPLPRVPRSSTCRLMSPSVAADAPIHILLLGSIQCGKSTLINAYRFAVTGSEAWAVSPSGRSGLRGTFRVRGYVAARSRRDADFLLIDTPGIALSEQRLRECSDLHPEEAMQIAGEDNKKRSSHRFELADPKMEHLLETLCDGMTFETDVARNYDQMDALDCTSVQNQVHHAFLVLSAKEILPESEVWGWKSWLKRVLIGSIPQNLLCTGHALDTAQTIGGAEPHPHVSSILKGTCALARWLEDRLYHAPYVIVTHMDVVGWYWKDAIFHTLREFVHESHITFLGLEQPHAYHEMPYAQRKTLQKLHERVMADIRWSVGNQ